MAPDTCTLQIRVFDGTRNLFASRTNILYRVIDANQKQIVVREGNTAALNCQFDFHDNFIDNYTVIVFADGWKQAGFTPVKLPSTMNTALDLMLIPQDGHPNFANATWAWAKAHLPFLAKGASDADAIVSYRLTTPKLGPQICCKY